MNELKKLQWIKPEVVKYPRIITESGTMGSAENPQSLNCTDITANFIPAGSTCMGNTSCYCLGKNPAVIDPARCGNCPAIP